MSGIRDERSPRRWSSAEETSAVIREDLSGESDVLYGIKLDFRGSDLQGVYLSDSWITGADFIGADLTGCDLDSASLTDAVVAGATLGGARGLVSGPVVVQVEPERHVLGGAKLQRWFTEYDATVEVRTQLAASERD